jgi:hypothetical protein
MSELQDPFGFGPGAETREHKAAPSVGGTQHGKGKDLFENLREFTEHGDPEKGAGVKKKAKSDDHNPRTKKLFESHGYTVYKTETINIREGAVWKTDLLGFMDYQAIKPGIQGVTAVQATSKGLIAPHIRKMRDIPEARVWLECGNRIVVVGWYQEGGKGSRWLHETKTVTIETLDEFEARRRK